MISMKEKIARAAYAAQWEGPYPESGVENGLALQVADAVLDALIEPTEGMTKSAPWPFNRDEHWPHHITPSFGYTPERVFRAMIQAARDGK